MTTERIIKHNGKYSSLEKRILDDTDITDENTDKYVSIKLVDEKCVTQMLIEAVAVDFYDEGGKSCKRGCMIKRFEFCKELIDNYIWADFFRSFVTSVRYAMIQCDNGFLSRYSYIWAEKTKNEQCVIAEILGLDKVYDMGEFISYVGWLKDEK